MGMSLHNAVAVFEGYVGRRTPFVRTPKFSIVKGEGSWVGSGYRVKRVSKLVWGEVLLSSVFFWAVWKGVSIGDMGLLPFHLLLAVGFLSVGGLSVKHAFQG